MLHFLEQKNFNSKFSWWKTQTQVINKNLNYKGSGTMFYSLKNLEQKEKIFQGIAQGRKKALENWFNDIWFAMESTRDTILAYLQDNELNLSEMNEILEDKKNQFKDFSELFIINKDSFLFSWVQGKAP